METATEPAPEPEPEPAPEPEVELAGKVPVDLVPTLTHDELKAYLAAKFTGLESCLLPNTSAALLPPLCPARGRRSDR